MKTTTFAVLILNAFATFRSREDAGAFGRRFDGQVIKNAATIAMLYFMLFFFGGITISVYDQKHNNYIQPDISAVSGQ